MEVIKKRVKTREGKKGILGINIGPNIVILKDQKNDFCKGFRFFL